MISVRCDRVVLVALALIEGVGLGVGRSTFWLVKEFMTYEESPCF